MMGWLQVRGHVAFPPVLTQQALDLLTGRQQDSSNEGAKEEVGSSTQQQRSRCEELSYQLVAAIVHSGGGASSGHYYAYCWEDAGTAAGRPAGGYLPLQEGGADAAGNPVDPVDLADLQADPLDPLDPSDLGAVPLGPRRQGGACPTAASAGTPVDPLVDLTDVRGDLRRQGGACPASAAASGWWWVASDRDVREAAEAEVLGCEATALIYDAYRVGGAGL